MKPVHAFAVYTVVLRLQTRGLIAIKVFPGIHCCSEKWFRIYSYLGQTRRFDSGCLLDTTISQPDPQRYPHLEGQKSRGSLCPLPGDRHTGRLFNWTEVSTGKLRQPS
jgi:hypothetical protein